MGNVKFFILDFNFHFFNIDEFLLVTYSLKFLIRIFKTLYKGTAIKAAKKPPKYTLIVTTRIVVSGCM